MKLTNLNCSRGAPMGRHSFGLDLPDLKVELERVPLVDGAYDVGGAYWGSPDNLWAYQHTDDDGETQMFGTLRAANRDEAIDDLLEEHPIWIILPENGTVIQQTIESLQKYLDDLPEKDRELAAGTEEEIDDLQGQLDEIMWAARLQKEKP